MSTKQDQFYIQDTRGFVGNSLLWWAIDGKGYVCDVRKAHRYTKAEADAITANRSTDKPWPCSYIDARVSHHVDHQLVDHAQAQLALVASPPSPAADPRSESEVTK